MRTIDIRVSHDDDLVVAQFLDTKAFIRIGFGTSTDPRSKRRDQRADLIG